MTLTEAGPPMTEAKSASLHPDAGAPSHPQEPIVFVCAPENGHPPYVGVGPGIRACPICGRGAR